MGTENTQRISETESALVHPFLPLAVRCTDDGRVIIQAGDHAGMVFDQRTGKVTVYGTAINFVADDLQLDGKPVDKPSLLSRARDEASKLVDRFGLKRAIRRQP